MCGLVGAFGTIYQKEKTALKWLLYFDVLRGPHSTGLSVVHREKDEREYKLMKSVGEPIFLYQDHKEEFDKDDLYKKASPLLMLGHNRYATVGGIDTNNAHPFEFDNLIGAHNGTVQMSSLKDFVGYQDHKVDSQIIFAELNANRDIDKVWKHVDGAMALTWWDKTDDSLNFARNKERPLSYTFTKDKRTCFWASEAWMLTVVLSKCGIEHGEIINVPENKHVKLLKDGFKEIEVVEKDLIPFVRPVYQNSSSNLGYVQRQYDDSKMRVMQIVEYCPANTWNKSFFVATDDEHNELVVCMPLDEGAAEKVVRKVQKLIDNNQPFFAYPDFATFFRNGYNTIHHSMLTHKDRMYLKKQEEEEEDSPRQVLSFQGEVITRAQWRKLDNTCISCGHPIHWKKAHKAFWIDDEYLACEDCKDVSWVLEWANAGKPANNVIEMTF